MGYSQEDASAGDTVIPDLFLVSSAIANDYGIYDRYEKCSQLIQTIESIHRYHSRPHDIVVIDASPVAVPDQLSDTISNMCLGFYQCHDHPVLTQLVDKHPNQSIIKSIGEQIIWHTFFKLVDKGILLSYRRLFKLSGRYQLTNQFTTDNYDPGGLICGSKRSWPVYEDLSEFTTVIPIRLLSFPWEMLEKMRQVFIYIDQLTVDLYLQKHQYHILEQQLFQALEKHNVPMQHLPMLGVQGHLAQDGVFVSE